MNMCASVAALPCGEKRVVLCVLSICNTGIGWCIVDQWREVKVSNAFNSDVIILNTAVMVRCWCCRFYSVC